MAVAIANRSRWPWARRKVSSSGLYGFIVATTKNGRGSGWRFLATETKRSSIASNSAAWSFGVARFTSSSTTAFANSGPGSNTCGRSAGLSERISMPMMSDGTRSAGHWMRASWPPMAGASMGARVGAADGAGDDAGERGLADARHVLDQQVAVREEADQRVTRRPLHLDHRPAHGRQEGAPLIAGAHQGQGVQLVDHPYCIGWVMPSGPPPTEGGGAGAAGSGWRRRG